MKKYKKIVEKEIKCWEFFKCKKQECPVYKEKDTRCWLYSGTLCREQIQGKFLEKMEMCLDCIIFKSNIKHVLLKETLSIINKQFKEYKRIVNDTDEQLRSISMELAIALSEVFDALKKISSGDYTVRLNEKSTIELISKLKRTINHTAKEIKKAEETLRFNKFAIEHTADSAFWMTSNGKFIYVNKAACKMLGYSKKELLSMTVYDIDPTFSKDIWSKNWKDLKNRKTFTFESIHKTKDGKSFPVEITYNFVKFEGREYNCAFVRNITNRKQILCELERSEQTFRAISSAAVNAILVMDDNGRITYWNPAAEKIFGYTKEEAMGKELHLLLAPPKYHNDYLRGFSRFKQTGKGKAIGVISEFTAIRKDGSEFPIEISTSSVLIRGKWHAVGIIRDITERKRAEEELKKSHANLRALSARINEIEENERRRLSREIHDRIGQKLTALGINLDFLIEQLSNQLNKDIIARLNDCKSLVKDIMKPIRNIITDLRPLILDDYGLASAIHWYSAQFTMRTNIPVVFKGQELKQRLNTDIETNLFRIMQEALNNIAKHANASRVNITLEEGKNNVRLKIVDNGIGFNPLDNNKTREKKGLGLIGMRERVEALDGNLIIESSPGKGTQILVEVKR